MLRQIYRRLAPDVLRPGVSLRRAVERQLNGTVLRGPFAGLQYGAHAICGAWYPKVLGTYEKELHHLLQKIAALRPPCIVDIGAAEGYYACGLAQMLPQTQIIAWEESVRGRFLLERTIALNGMQSRVQVRTRCEPDQLEKLLRELEGPVFILCDAEGSEYDLMNVAAIPALERCHLLVELHDFSLPDITKVIGERFAATHDVTAIPSVARARTDFPFFAEIPWSRWLPDSYLLQYVDERPFPQIWLWMEPKATA